MTPLEPDGSRRSTSNDLTYSQ